MPPTKVVICGAGLHGSALAFYLTKMGHNNVLVVERESVAAAASGKGGGFLARDWGSGCTEQLHQVSYELHAQLAAELNIESYRTIPVLEVAPGQRTASTADLCPWLDGNVAQVGLMDESGGAQVAPLELCTKLMDAAVAAGATLLIGEVQGVTTENTADGTPQVTGVKVDGETIETDCMVITLGPWANLASEWFGTPFPITGIKSTSVTFDTGSKELEPFALFCGEDDRFGVGGSEHITPEQLCQGLLSPAEVLADPARVEAAVSAMKCMSPRIGSAQTVAQCCMRPCAPDGLPLMGKVGAVRNAYMSAGHNCWGILWAPVSGKAMAELILDGQASCVDLSAFSPDRFMKIKRGRGKKRGKQSMGEQW